MDAAEELADAYQRANHSHGLALDTREPREQDVTER
jgi:hypothetical protein